MADYNNLTFLIVEDEDMEFTLIQHALKNAWKHTFSVIRVKSTEEAVEYVRRMRIDVLFLDLNVLDTKGLESVQKVSQYVTPQTVVIVTTSMNDKNLAVESLKLGAQDYLIKGEYSAESLSRALLHALARNEKSRGQNKGSQIHLDNFKVDLLRQKLIFSANGKQVETDLTPTELKLLSYLASHFDSPVGRDAIADHVLGDEVHVSDRTIDNQISRLRGKLADTNYTIQSVRGVGYRLHKI